MKPHNNEITKLSEDIREIFAHAFGTKSEMIRLCKDHRNPYLHTDKEPVLDITQDDFVGIFDNALNHFFIHSDQAFRLGQYCGLSIPNLIALMLKAEWEIYLCDCAGCANETAINPGPILTDKDLIGSCINGFSPNKKEIINLITNNSSGSESGLSVSEIVFFIQGLLEDSHFLIKNEQVTDLFPGNGITEKIILHKTPEPQREEYIRMKELWNIKSSEIDDILMKLERKKRLNMGIENKYYRTFYREESDRLKGRFRLKKYKVMLEIIKDQPGLTYRELVEMAGERMTEAEKEIGEIRNRIARSQNCIEDIISQGTFSQVSEEFRNSYMESCKTLLRELFFLLHTDTCPNYLNLPRKKKNSVNKLWLMLMKSTKNELYSYSPMMLLYSMPDYEQLEAIYRNACKVLDIYPHKIAPGNRLDFMISKGVSLQAIMEFMKRETDQMGLHLAHLEMVQNEYTNEEQARVYKHALSNISQHTENLKNEVAEIKKQITIIKKEIRTECKKVLER